MIKELLDAMDELETLPYRFPVSRAGSSKLRQLVGYPYIILYRVHEAQRLVQIVSIEHGSRRR